MRRLRFFANRDDAGEILEQRTLRFTEIGGSPQVPAGR
jgi:hypothetical protein